MRPFEDRDRIFPKITTSTNTSNYKLNRDDFKVNFVLRNELFDQIGQPKIQQRFLSRVSQLSQVSRVSQVSQMSQIFWDKVKCYKHRV